MDCTEFLNRYSEYDDSLIPAAEADRFRAHMAGCGRCARYDRVLRKGRMLARQMPEVEPSDDFVPRLQARLGQALRPAAPGPGPVPAGAAVAGSPAVLRLDRERRSSYSPHVTGPPAFDGARPQPGAWISAYRTLD